LKKTQTDPVGLMRQVAPFAPSVGSDQLGWTGLHAVRFQAKAPVEINAPALAQHALVLILRPPEKLDLRYEGVKRDTPPPPGSILLVPAHYAVEWLWSGNKDSLHIFLEPGLVEKVANESFLIDPPRTGILPLDGVSVPELRSAMLAVNAELSAGGVGGRSWLNLWPISCLFIWSDT
jgi:hypothetical protein